MVGTIEAHLKIQPLENATHSPTRTPRRASFFDEKNLPQRSKVRVFESRPEGSEATRTIQIYPLPTTHFTNHLCKNYINLLAVEGGNLFQYQVFCFLSALF